MICLQTEYKPQTEIFSSLRDIKAWQDEEKKKKHFYSFLILMLPTSHVMEEPLCMIVRNISSGLPPQKCTKMSHLSLQLESE